MLSSNHPSATANLAPVAQGLERELSLNRKAGPFFAPTFSNFVWFPKKHSQPPKWHIINDLSWLAGQSVDDAFSKELYTCSYDSMDQTISYLKSFGLKALISKLDLSDAIYNMLVDPVTGRFWGPNGPSLCLTVLRVLVISPTCYFHLLSGVRRRYFLNLLTVCDTRWRSMEPLWNYPHVLGLWPSRPKRRLFFES